MFWIQTIFSYRDKEVMSKCGLDAYFFLRYLQTLLIIFVPLAFVLLPVLLPINYVGGKGQSFIEIDANSSNTNSTWNVTGLDTVAWGNVTPQNTNRYWGHMVMGIIVVIWVCFVFFAELRVYIRVRQDFLTSPEHRLRASATTVLVNSIPQKWLTEKALMRLYDVFPGGIRNIWLNRNYGPLLGKIWRRESILKRLEEAETHLIRKCKLAQMKKTRREAKLKAQKAGLKRLTKEEKEQQAKMADAEAQRLAQGEEGVSSGDPHQVHHTVEDEVKDKSHQRGIFKIPVISQGLSAVSHGVSRGLGTVGSQFERAGQAIVGGVKVVGRDFGGEGETIHDFVTMDSSSQPVTRVESSTSKPAGVRNAATIPQDEVAKSREPAQVRWGHGNESPVLPSPDPSQVDHDRATSQASLHPVSSHFGTDGASDEERAGISDNWLKFWRGPAIGFVSPKPHGYSEKEFPFQDATRMDGAGDREQDSETVGSKHKRRRPTMFEEIINFITSFFASNPEEQIQYPPAYDENYREDAEGEALWERYIRPKDRLIMKIPKIKYVPCWFPFSSRTVDTIYYCRAELARLNIEIEEDQKHPERYPLLNSAFIQFNHQVAAHMASQSVSHHIPKQMAPRTVEISPNDVLWDNMSLRWWEEWVRISVIVVIVSGMVILWAIPIGATAALNDLPALLVHVPGLKWVNDNATVRSALKSLGGVLPAIAVQILMLIVPIIFYKLAFLQGSKTGMMKELSVQNYYFFFSFVQIFLVVAISSGALATLRSSATNLISIPSLLAENLPSSANYFFSYMILQAMGTSSGALMQYVTLVLWFILPKILDSTPRDKWTRNTTLTTIQWGCFFPTFTTLACITLVYSTIAPLILVFAIISFSLFWLAYRYCMLYIYKLQEDTGGLLYPRAINQSFMGLYFMELCMIGLFILVRDDNNNSVCIPQAIVMAVVGLATIVYQVLLHKSFAPLYRYLPITLEDDAVLRDEAFERAQAARFDREEEIAGEGKTNELYQEPLHNTRDEEDIEMKNLHRQDTNSEVRKYNRMDPRNAISTTAAWAAHGTRVITRKTFGHAQPYEADRIIQRRKRRHRDLDLQRKIGDALFGGINDEIEDLTPQERDVLVNRAFTHAALRARRPTVWIPRDDLGISDEEIRRTEAFSMGNIWISNEGTALDSKAYVVYGRNPPDFDEVDLIRL
jgi:calcium permeable stress-gated cation channel